MNQGETTIVGWWANLLKHFNSIESKTLALSTSDDAQYAQSHQSKWLQPQVVFMHDVSPGCKQATVILCLFSLIYIYIYLYIFCCASTDSKHCGMTVKNDVAHVLQHGVFNLEHCEGNKKMLWTCWERGPGVRQTWHPNFWQSLQSLRIWSDRKWE